MSQLKRGKHVGQSCIFAKMHFGNGLVDDEKDFCFHFLIQVGAKWRLQRLACN